MEQKIIVKHVNGLKRCHSIISEVGDLSHELTFDVVLAPGDLERTLMMFKQRIPVIMEITSPQSKMDLVIAVVLDPDSQENDVLPVKGRE